MAQAIEAQILAAEQARCAAMLANDAGGLDAVLAPDLRFAHATGAVDDKPAFLAKMAAGRIKYAGIDWSEEEVRLLGPDAAMLTGRMTTRVQVEGVDKTLQNRAVTVWMKSDAGWRLSYFQSTPVKA